MSLILLPPTKFLNVVYSWCIKRIDPDKREQWEIMLDSPLPWQKADKAPTPEQIEREGQDFMNFMNQVQAGK